MRNSNKQPLCLCNAICNCHEECSPQGCDVYFPSGPNGTNCIVFVTWRIQRRDALKRRKTNEIWSPIYNLASGNAARAWASFCYFHLTCKFQGLGTKPLQSWHPSTKLDQNFFEEIVCTIIVSTIVSLSL